MKDMGIINKLIKGKSAGRTAIPEKNESKRGRIIPPHIVACKVCEGKGEKDGLDCPQCKGSGRVIVSCEVTTYVSAYMPENKNKEEKL